MPRVHRIRGRMEAGGAAFHLKRLQEHFQKKIPHFLVQDMCRKGRDLTLPFEG